MFSHVIVNFHNIRFRFGVNFIFTTMVERSLSLRIIRLAFATLNWYQTMSGYILLELPGNDKGKEN